MGGNPIQRRWMCFVDGENLTIRGQDVLETADLEPVRGQFWERDVLLWVPGTRPKFLAKEVRTGDLGREPQRMHFYTSAIGSPKVLDQLRDNLWGLGFQPTVLQGSKGRPSKGVDIALACDALSNAFRDNYDVAVLITGDGDYVPLVEEVKRLGKLVHLVFFESNGLNQELRRACDSFQSLDDTFLEGWWNYAHPQIKAAGLQTPDGKFNYSVHTRRESDDIRGETPLFVKFWTQSADDRKEWVAPINGPSDVSSLGDQALFELWYESCPQDLKPVSTQARKNDV